MKRITFKLIPFLISLFIVIGSVTGICLYSYYSYDNNKLRFVADYFHYEDFSDFETERQIEDFVKFKSANYQVVNDNLTYIDSRSRQKYSENPLGETATKSQFPDATWSNGVLNIPGYFKIKAYGLTTYNKDVKKFIYNYYFYIFDVNYDKVDVNNLYFIFVDGDAEAISVKKAIGEEDEKIDLLDAAINEIKEGKNGNANTVNLESYKFTGKSVTSYSMYIRDNNSTNSKKKDDDPVPYVYRLTTLSETLLEENKDGNPVDDKGNIITKSRAFSEIKNVNFAIYDSHGDELGSKIEDFEEIVRGSYEAEFTKADDFNKAAEENKSIHKGANDVIYDAGYGKFIWVRIFVEGLVTLLISGVLGVLFYLIWQDDEEESKASKSRKKLKKISK